LALRALFTVGADGLLHREAWDLDRAKRLDLIAKRIVAGRAGAISSHGTAHAISPLEMANAISPLEMANAVSAHGTAIAISSDEMAIAKQLPGTCQALARHLPPGPLIGRKLATRRAATTPLTFRHSQTMPVGNRILRPSQV
jgi:hypothetical protein